MILTVLLVSVFSTDAYSRNYHNDNYDSWDVVYDGHERRGDRWDRDYHRRGRECRNDRQIVNAAYDLDRSAEHFADMVRRRRGQRLFNMARELSFETGKFLRMAERRLPCRALTAKFDNVRRAFQDLRNQVSSGRGFIRGEFNELRRDFRRLRMAVSGERNYPAPRPRY